MPERTTACPGTPSRGQLAYETYAQLLQTQWPMAVWARLSRLERYAWEAAAQAVLDLRDFPPLDLTPREEEPR